MKTRRVLLVSGMLIRESIHFMTSLIKHRSSGTSMSSRSGTVTLVALPPALIIASGAGRKLKVDRSLPSGLCSVTVVRSALLRYTLALNFA